MCCLGRLCVKGILVPINGCYLVIGIISLISFGFLKFGVSLFLNALTNLIHEAPGGIGDNVKPSELASVLQPYFDLVAWPLFGVAVVFVALGAFGIAATCCPTCCRWFGWAYIGILGAALAGLIIFIVVWFLTASSRVSAIRANIKDQIRTDYVDFWQLNNQNLNVKALVLNFVHAHFECCGISETDPQSDYLDAIQWVRNYTIQGNTYLSVIPRTCCKVDNNWTPEDVKCPVYPNVTNSYINKSCYDTVYNNYIAPYVWIQWIVYVFFGIIIFGPAILMYFLIKKDSEDE